MSLLCFAGSESCDEIAESADDVQEAAIAACPPLRGKKRSIWLLKRQTEIHMQKLLHPCKREQRCLALFRQPHRLPRPPCLFGPSEAESKRLGSIGQSHPRLKGQLPRTFGQCRSVRFCRLSSGQSFTPQASCALPWRP